MEIELLKTVGQIAGIGGLSIGMVFLIFREVIRKKIFPNLTKAQSFKIITLVVVCTWSIALAGIAAWVYTESYEPHKKEEIELSGVETYLKTYGYSTVSIVDLNIKNRGSLSENITKLKVNIKDVFKFSYDPCPICARFFADGIYNVNFKDIVDGNNEYIISHVIAPESIEKINFVFGGSHIDDSYLARITLTVFTGSGRTLETKPFDVLVQNFDYGKTVSLDQVGETKLKEFIDSGTKAPVALTPELIESFFHGGTNSPKMGALVPPVPEWFKS